MTFVITAVDQIRLTVARRRTVRRLAQSRGEVGQGKEGGVNFFREFAVHLRCVAYTLPLGVVLERFPVGASLFQARVLTNGYEGVAVLRHGGGRPIRNVFPAVAFQWC